MSLEMPPLRDRCEDIPMLTRYFAAKHGKRVTRKLSGLSPAALARLEAYDWPGNVRELENAIERAVALGTTELIIPEDLPEAVLDMLAAVEAGGGYHHTVREEKKRAILAALGRGQLDDQIVHVAFTAQAPEEQAGVQNMAVNGVSSAASDVVVNEVYPKAKALEGVQAPTDEQKTDLHNSMSKATTAVDV